MTYEYICQACGHQWEAQQRISEDPLKDCPSCGEAAAKRQISRGGGFILKGGGWYSDLYSSAPAKKEGAESTAASSEANASSSDSKSSESKSETKSETKTENAKTSSSADKPATSSTSSSSTTPSSSTGT